MSGDMAYIRTKNLPSHRFEDYGYHRLELKTQVDTNIGDRKFANIFRDRQFPGLSLKSAYTTHIPNGRVDQNRLVTKYQLVSRCFFNPQG